MSAADCPLTQLPPPSAIHQRMGALYRELTLLRRLLRLSQAVRHGATGELPPNRREGGPNGRWTD
jgi:hypothetical protein